MKLFCTDRVKLECEKLEKNNSYSDLRQCLYVFISNKKSIQDWKSGSRVRCNPKFLFLKKRIEGSGGYRIYYLLVIKNEEVTLSAIYPKSGSKKAVDLNDKGKVVCLQETLDQMTQQCRWLIKLVPESNSIAFEAQKKAMS